MRSDFSLNNGVTSCITVPKLNKNGCCKFYDNNTVVVVFYTLTDRASTIPSK